MNLLFPRRSQVCLLAIFLTAALFTSIRETSARGAAAGRPATGVRPVAPIQPIAPITPIAPARPGYGYNGAYGYGGDTVVAPAYVPAPSLPQGALTALPSGAMPMFIKGQTYYFANNAYYSQQTFNGATIYVPANP